jgi:PAS domain S-box-containing protein
VIRGPELLPTFPGFAVDLVLILVFGAKYWPVLLAAYVESSLLKHISWPASSGIAVAALARDLAAVWFLRWLSGMRKRLGDFEDLVGVVTVAFIAPGLAAGIGTILLVASGKFPASRWAGVLSVWWIADALGVLIAAPGLLAIARFFEKSRPQRSPWLPVQAVAFMLGVTGVCYLVFFQVDFSYWLFSVFLLVLMAAAWIGTIAARTAAFIIASMAIWATRNGVGPFSAGTLLGNLENLALFLAAASLTGMAVGAFRRANKLVLPAGVLVAGWALSGWLYGSMDRDRTAYDGARLDTVITSVQTRINNRYQTYEKVLWAAAGMIAASDETTPQRWHTFVQRLQLLDTDPGATAMAIVEPVSEKELDAFVQAHQRRGWPPFAPHNIDSVRALVASPEHLLVICAEPPAVAARSIGVDLVGDPLRRAAAEQARDSGAAVLTKITTLGDRSGRALQLFVPVYRDGAPLSTAEQRRNALIAWVTIVFRADTFFSSALSEVENVLALKAYYGGHPAGDQLFASTASRRVPAAPDRITHLTLGGDSWTLEWRRLPNFPYVSRTPSAWAAGCMALLSLLLAGLIITLQDTMRRATDRLELIESTSALATWELDLNSRTVECSKQFLRLYGIPEIQGRITLDQWLSRIHPDDRQLVSSEITGPRLAPGSIDRQYRVLTQEGSVRWLHSRALRMFDDQGQNNRVVGVDLDVSDLKHLQSQLAQAQKLESVGQLAAGVAHEINTPIQYVGDNAKFLDDAFRQLIRASDAPQKAFLAEDPPTQAELDYLKREVPTAIFQLLEGVSQVARIVRAMKEFAHPGSIETAAVDINRTIESTILVSRHEWKFVAEVTTDFDPELPLVPCVAGELNQVILNLIVNAAHAISDVVRDSGRKGRIHISTRRRDSMAEIALADTGAGIPESIQSRVFDPFFTTKPVGKGTGQGLAIAHAVIVQKYKGTLRFQSEPGRGTTFFIELPLVRELETV